MEESREAVAGAQPGSLQLAKKLIVVNIIENQNPFSLLDL